MRLIDADAMRKEFCKRCNSSICSGSGKERCGTVIEIDNHPTIDAVPVVRCKDCANHTTAYFGKKVDESEVYFIKDKHNHWNDWFCADGERKTE